MKSRAYRATSVKRVLVGQVLSGREGQDAVVGLDIGKESILVVLRWGSEDVERPWRVSNPLELRELVQLLMVLAEGRKLVVAMEPTGTYGDPLRQLLSDAGLAVHRVSPKASHDYAEVFDGVPSQHDGKDAAVVAELAALGKLAAWPFMYSEWEEELAYWVDRRDVQRGQLVEHYGRLEAFVARHWPEATRLLPLTSGVLLRCLVEYGGPAGLCADRQALERLQKWGRGKLSREKAESILASAQSSVGVRQGEFSVRQMRDYAQAVLACRQEMRECAKQIERLSEGQEVLQRQAAAVGIVTASVLWVHLGDPRNYDSAEAYRKAMGLNLTESSSGKWLGRLRISKRGPSEVRRHLFYAALRQVRQADVGRWYASQLERRGNQPGAAKRALVGVMRKISLALYQVAVRDEAFDPARLFPGVPVPAAAVPSGTEAVPAGAL